MTSLVPYHFILYKAPILIYFDAAAEREGSYPQGRSHPRPLLMLAFTGLPALLSTGETQLCIWIKPETSHLPCSFLTQEPPSTELVT